MTNFVLNARTMLLITPRLSSQMIQNNCDGFPELFMLICKRTKDKALYRLESVSLCCDTCGKC